MLKIGITGGIGSGKTTICKIFELLKIPVFYADDEAKKLMVTDAVLIAKIKETFGVKSYDESNNLDRNYLANKVFTNKDELKKLNSLVHPAVFNAMEKWASIQKSPYVLKEAALLFESGSYQQNDLNILVSSPLGLRVARVIARDGSTEEKVMQRIAHQMPEEEKEKKADYILLNNEHEFLIPQVLKIHQQIIAVSNGR